MHSLKVPITVPILLEHRAIVRRLHTRTQVPVATFKLKPDYLLLH